MEKNPLKFLAHAFKRGIGFFWGVVRKVGKAWKLILKVLAILVLISVVGAGAFYVKVISYNPPVPATERGVFFEELLPKDTLAVLSFNPSDAAQRNMINNLFETVLQDKASAALPFLASKFLSEEKDIATLAKFVDLIKTDLRGVVAITNEKDKSSTLIMLALKDAEGMKAILKKGTVLVEEKENILVQYEGMYAGVIKDVFFWADSEEAARGISSTLKRPWAALTNSSEFKNAMKSANAPFSGYVFINTNEPGKNTLFPTIGTSGSEAGAISNAVAFYRAAQDGIYLDTISFAKNKSGKVDENVSASIYKKVSADKLVAFIEMHGLGNLLLEQMVAEVKANSEDKKISKEDLENQAYEQLGQMIGFDFKAEIMPILSGNFAFSVHNLGSNIPAITLTLDVSGQAQAADAFVKKLDLKIAQLISFANLTFKTNEKDQILTLEKLQTAKSGGLVKIYFDRISKNIADIPLFKLLPSPMEIAYGITDDGLMFFSTTPDFGKIFTTTNTIDGSELFAQAKASGADASTLFILNSSTLLELAQRFVDSTKKAGTFSKDDEAIYEIIKKHVLPVKSVVQLSKSDGANIKGKIFVKIVK